MPMETRRKSYTLTATPSPVRFTRHTTYGSNISSNQHMSESSVKTRKRIRIKSVPYERSTADEIEVSPPTTPVPDLIEQVLSPPSSDMYDEQTNIDHEASKDSNSEDIRSFSSNSMIKDELASESSWSYDSSRSLESTGNRRQTINCDADSQTNENSRPVRGCRYVPHNGLRPSAVATSSEVEVSGSPFDKPHSQPRRKKQYKTGRTKSSSCPITPIYTPHTASPTASTTPTRSSEAESVTVPSILVAPSLSDFDDSEDDVGLENSRSLVNLSNILGIDTESIDLDTAALLTELLATISSTSELISTLRLESNSIGSTPTLPVFPSSLNDDHVKQELTLDSILSTRKSRWKTRTTTRLAASDFLGSSSAVWKQLLENDELQDLEKGFYESLIDHGWRGANNKDVAKACVASWITTNENWLAKERRTSVIVEAAKQDSKDTEVDTDIDDYLTLNSSDCLADATIRQCAEDVEMTDLAVPSTPSSVAALPAA